MRFTFDIIKSMLYDIRDEFYRNAKVRYGGPTSHSQPTIQKGMVNSMHGLRRSARIKKAKLCVPLKP